MFISGLSINEFILSPNVTVLGVVSGTFVYQVRELDFPENSQIMKALTKSRTKILRAAYDRMQDEAKRLGASGIIGCHISQRELAQDLWEYTVQGTALGSCPSEPGQRPFVCTFSGQDYYSLTAAGYRPIGVVLGVCIYYQKYHQRVQQRILGSGKAPMDQNAERSDFTRGIYTARRYAMSALEAEASALGAIGVLGVSVTAKHTLNRQRGTTQGMLIEFTALGTAIVSASSGLSTVDYCLLLAD